MLAAKVLKKVLEGFRFDNIICIDMQMRQTTSMDKKDGRPMKVFSQENEVEIRLRIIPCILGVIINILTMLKILAMNVLLIGVISFILLIGIIRVYTDRYRKLPKSDGYDFPMHLKYAYIFSYCLIGLHFTWVFDGNERQYEAACDKGYSKIVEGDSQPIAK